MNEDLTNGASEQSEIARLTALVLEMKASFEQRLDRQEQEIAALREVVELRHYDTRPLWELISREMEQMRAAIEELRAKVDELSAGQQEMRAKIEELNGKVEELNGKVGELNGKVGELNGKVEEIRRELAAFRADTNHNFKVLDRKIREAFGDIGDLRDRLSFIEEQFPQEEMRT